MSFPRFYVPGLPNQGLVDLPDSEAHHAIRVLRCQVDDQVVLFDGLGNQALGAIAEIAKKLATVRLIDFQFVPRDHDGRLHLAIAMPKGERQRSTIEHLVELGVDTLTPIDSERSVARISVENIDRLNRYAIESCKQCQRNRTMAILAPISLSQVSAIHADKSIWLMHPTPSSDWTFGQTEREPPPVNQSIDKLLFVIGPEGGFTQLEIDHARQSGAKLLCLGDRILRVETAVACAAVIGSHWLAISRSMASRT